MTHQSRDISLCTLGFRLSTLVMYECLSVATSIRYVDKPRLIYAWEPHFRQLTLVVYTLPLLRLSERQRFYSKFMYGRDLRELEDWLEAQPQRFVLLGITNDSYDAVIWVTSQFSGP
jgi:hypothetical protein